MSGAFHPLSLSWEDALLRIGMAAVLSLSIGIERFIHGKPVDFRPFVIIAAAACALAISTLELGPALADENVSIDPTRVINGVMTGIGFLGAGAMFRERELVQGAGSAASIWAAGAIGIVCGLGSIWLGGLLTGVVVLSLLIGRMFASDYTVDAAKHRDEGDQA